MKFYLHNDKNQMFTVTNVKILRTIAENVIDFFIIFMNLCVKQTTWNHEKVTLIKMLSQLSRSRTKLRQAICSKRLKRLLRQEKKV